MSRPLRIEFPGAVYHLTSRGDRREAIFSDDQDRAQFLSLLALACARFQVRVLVYCLMGNHYHLVVQTSAANLSAFMRQINGVYTQAFNRRHGLVGHLFQGRFKAILVDRDAYLLRLCQYVELNPVRAQLVPRAEDWSWSSYRAHTALADAPPWLDRATVAAFVLEREPLTARDHLTAARRYAKLVAQSGLEQCDSFWTNALRQQIYLGDQAFIERIQARVDEANLSRGRRSSHRRSEVPSPQRSKPRSLQYWLRTQATRGDALRAAHVESGITMTALAQELGLSVGRVSQLIKVAEGRAKD
jgi:REP element-mobilizing transposase RayT